MNIKGLYKPRASIFRVSCTALLASPLLGCGMPKEQRTVEPSEYTFLLGPEPYSINGEERRQLVTIPAKYIETKRSDNPIRLGQFTFAVDFPTGNPVPHDKLGYKDALIVSVISAPVGSVKRRVDGSWQNHFSGYPVKKGKQYNLSIFGRTEWFQRSLLYVSDDMNTIIECEQIVDNKATNCVMMNQMFENVVVQISFDPSQLRQWKGMLSLAYKLVGKPKRYDRVTSSSSQGARLTIGKQGVRAVRSRLVKDSYSGEMGNA